MKKSIAIVVALFITFVSCNTNEKTSSTPVVFENESGDVWDTISITTAFPVTLVTNVEMEIKDNHDTTITHSEKFLKIKVSGGYSQYCAFTEGILVKMLLSEKVSAGYCLDIKVLVKSYNSFSNREASVISYSIEKIKNHMGG
ncbi:MAG: hypothetical protein NTW62_00160 [Candidatus Nomurabacteria bacterium]|nr:hypothetical protein [Candidatus Nomurabacteria bacterium]